MRIACLLSSMFEDTEFQAPYQAFREAGHQVLVVGSKGGEELEGYRGKVSQKTDRGISEARPDEFDALFIPGGYSPDHLRADPHVVDFARSMVESGRPCFAICHGPQLLITADVVQGRRMTAWPTIQGDLRKVGANVADEEVVVDDGMVTSRRPDDIPAFVNAALATLEERAPTRH
jgi:protease I